MNTTSKSVIMDICESDYWSQNPSSNLMIYANYIEAYLQKSSFIWPNGVSKKKYLLTSDKQNEELSVLALLQDRS